MITSRETRLESARRNNPNVIAYESAMYRKAHTFLTELRSKWRRNEITGQQYSTLRGQALSGNLEGAIKGLYRVINDNAERGAYL